MRSDEVLILDMLRAARRISGYVKDMAMEEFLRDYKSQDAVQHQIMVMGEAAKKVSHGYKERNVTVPWAAITQLRNFYIHAYHSVDFRRLWDTANGMIADTERKLVHLLPDDAEVE
jgi:uncharacterized protein with HEPN domain